MDSMSCIQGWSAGATANLSQMASSLRGGEVGQTMSAQSGIQAAGTASLSSMVNSISQTFAQMTQSTGGSSSSEQLMRTLLAAIMLLALLDQTQRASESQGGSQGLSSQGGTMHSEMTSSFTFISIEQSMTSFSAVADYAQFNSSSSSTTGGQLDVSA